MFHNSQSNVQREMLEFMRQCAPLPLLSFVSLITDAKRVLLGIDGQGQNKNEVLNRLTMAKVRSGDNRRIGDTTPIQHSHDHVRSLSLIPPPGAR